MTILESMGSFGKTVNPVARNRMTKVKRQEGWTQEIIMESRLTSKRLYRHQNSKSGCLQPDGLLMFALWSVLSP